MLHVSKLRRTVSHNITVLQEVLEPFGLRPGLDLTKTVDHWMSLIEIAGGDWVKVTKYKLSAFFAFHRKQELPVSPFGDRDRPDFILGGGAGRWLKSALRGERKTEILSTIKQAKKGMTRPGPKELSKAKQDYLKHMTESTTGNFQYTDVKEFKIDWADVTDDLISLSTHPINLELELRRTVREIFRDSKPMTWDDRIRPFFPSTSANYINNRKDAGVIGTICDHPELLDGLRSGGGGIRTKRQDLDNDDEISQTRGVTVDESVMQSRFKTFWIRVIKKAKQEIPLVEPVALSEALKVRMITKGPPFLYTSMRNLWKHIHNNLRRHPTFELIGKPVNAELILNAMGARLEEDEEYLSGDFQSATDLIKTDATRIVADEVAKVFKIEGTEKELFIRSLVDHIFGSGKQVAGQLMGSITSFPILCIIVATACRWAAEVTSGKQIPLRNLPLRVNGDDNLMRCKKGTQAIWRIICKSYGLIESVGKTYASREFLEINSMTFERLSEPYDFLYTNSDTGRVSVRKQWFRQNGYINAGLLYGLKRSTGRVGAGDLGSQYDDISIRARQLLEMCPKGMEEKVMKMFLNKHRKFLSSLNLPWYIPQWLGGLGLPTGPWGGPSDLDRRIAHHILLNWKNRRPQHVKYHERPWRIWEIASKLLPEPVYTERKGAWTEEYNHTVARKCVDLLFDGRISLKQLKVESEEVTPWRALRHNARLWVPPKKALPSPLSDEELQYIQLYPNWDISDTFGSSRKTQRQSTQETESLPNELLTRLEVD